MKKPLTILIIAMMLIATIPGTATATDDCNIELTTTEMVFFVKQGTQSSQNLGIYNRGIGKLMFSLSKNYQDAPETSYYSEKTYAANGKMLVDPPYLDFGTVPNRGSLTRTITCTVTGEEYLQVSATGDQGWISTQVQNVSKDVVTVLVTINLNDLVQGQLYRGNVILTSNAGMQQVPILLQVATSNIKDWLSYDPASGMIDGGKSTATVVLVDASTLKPGDYYATITVTSNDPDQPLINVSVKMTVLASSAPPPQVQTFFAYPGNNKVHLFWDPVVAVAGGMPVVGYNIYRATYPDGYSDMAITDFFVSGMQYTDPNVQNGITYYYIIKSVDQNGIESDASAEVKVLPNLIEPSFNIEDGQVTRKQYFEITGKVEPNSSLVINGQPVPLNPDGTFTHGVMLKNGVNPIDIVCVDPITDPIVNPNPDNTYSYRFNINFAPVTTIIMTVGFKDATINGQYVKDAMPVPPTIVDGRALVPFRFLGESLGAKIGWDANAYKVTYELEGKIVEMWIGQKVAKVNGKSITVDPPPQIIGGSTLVPVRFITDNLGASVEWYSATKTILVRYPKS
ncbi:MAG: stalk domain-containing protein [Caldisericia bacterium]